MLVDGVDLVNYSTHRVGDIAARQNSAYRQLELALRTAQNHVVQRRARGCSRAIEKPSSCGARRWWFLAAPRGPWAGTECRRGGGRIRTLCNQRASGRFGRDEKIYGICVSY